MRGGGGGGQFKLFYICQFCIIYFETLFADISKGNMKIVEVGHRSESRF